MGQNIKVVASDRMIEHENFYCEFNMSLGLNICICENKDGDELRVNREADQRLCSRYTDSARIRNFKPKAICPVCVEPGRKLRGSIFSQRRRGSYRPSQDQGCFYYLGHVMQKLLNCS